MIRAWAWRDFLVITLGFWLMAWPGLGGLFEREPGLAWNNLLCGAAAVVLGVMGLVPRFDLARWGTCAIGCWLLFSPLVFWTQSAGTYDVNTLVGTLLIIFSVLVPMMPGRSHHKLMSMPGPDTPPGWSYNPSDWVQRAPIIAMALFGYFVARYLAAFQLGHVDHPWDPFFVDGTRAVLASDVSKAFPISDAGLGAVAYLLEALSGCMGGRNRWRTMPWMVAMFGVLVVPLGVVSIVLVILQPVAVGAWCTLCLVTAAAMLVMIAPALDEVVAMCQFLVRARGEGRPFWRTFWLGGTLALESRRTTAPPPPPLSQQLVSALDLNHVPWNLLVSTALGIGLMTSPGVLGVTGALADSLHLTGALAVTCAVIAFGEIARPVRLLNLPLGLWVAVAPWLLADGTGPGRLSSAVGGVALALLSLPRGRIAERFGAWNRHLIW
ncbi:MAG: vitamin K epoxide reductase family protein [Myxococcota bacterium]